MSQTLVIFGASGDLAQLKIYPAVFELFAQNYLESDFNLVGFARSKIEQSAFKEMVKDSIQKKVQELEVEVKLVESFLEKVSYVSGLYDSQDDLGNLFSQISNLTLGKSETSDSQIVCYFSVPPTVFESLVVGLGQFNEKYNLKMVIEKPFGVSEESARWLYSKIAQNFNDDQFYLLDHYLGKLSVRDILVLRQQNSILNHLIKGKHIKSIQISALETLGVNNRLGYFDTVGTIRDMIQSHLLQVLALACMDLPLNKASVAREKEHILSSIQFTPNSGNLIVGQYEEYRSQDPAVANSNTETFAAVKLCIDRQDWHSTPIYIRTGKNLAEKRSQVVIEFSNLVTQNPNAPTNKLILEFAPNESLSMHLSHTFGTIESKESLACSGPGCLTDYALLLNDVFKGEHLHFVTFDQIIQSWRVTDQILAFKENLVPVIYTSGKNPKFENEIFEDKKSIWY